MFKIIIAFLLGVFFSSHVYFEYVVDKKQKQMEKTRKIEYIKTDLPEQLYVLKPNDSVRLQDCSDEDYVYHGEKLQSHKFMEFFEGKNDPINGFVYSNKWPVFNYLHGVSTMDDETRVLLGLRGNTAGPHRSRVTKVLYDIHNTYGNTLIYMPSSFYAVDNGKIEDKTTILQSVCHGRYYAGTYIGFDWPGMTYGGSWRIYEKLLKDKAHVFLFAYSNGQVVQDEFLKTFARDGYKPDYVSIANEFEFLEEYSSKTIFASEKVNHLDGIVDIETNYSRGRPLWDLAKYVKEHVDGDRKKLFYSACGIESVMAYNHILLIRAFGLMGFEMSNGVVRYMNDSRNIVIDILTYNQNDPYVYGRVNLRTQTVFLKDNRVNGYRLSLGHYNIVPYAASQFKHLAGERGILSSK